MKKAELRQIVHLVYQDEKKFWAKVDGWRYLYLKGTQRSR